jgi:hypothetical protein
LSEARTSGSTPRIGRREVFPEALRTAIEGADAFVFIITPEAIASRYCRSEVDHAATLGKRIGPAPVWVTPEACCGPGALRHRRGGYWSSRLDRGREPRACARPALSRARLPRPRRTLLPRWLSSLRAPISTCCASANRQGRSDGCDGPVPSTSPSQLMTRSHCGRWQAQRRQAVPRTGARPPLYDPRSIYPAHGSRLDARVDHAGGAHERRRRRVALRSRGASPGEENPYRGKKTLGCLVQW